MTIKLIRDRVPVDDGGREFAAVQGSGRIAFLFDKLHEETSEASEAWSAGDDGLVTELADCLEVLLALAEATGISEGAVEAARQAKLRERGGFTLGRLYELAD